MVIFEILHHASSSTVVLNGDFQEGVVIFFIAFCFVGSIIGAIKKGE